MTCHREHHLKKDEQLRMIRKNVGTWNQARSEDPSLYPDLGKANLYKANLYKANLSYAKLSEADLSKANLNGADLSEAYLRGTDLREADLIGTNLRKADLRGAALNEANLRGADLREADLREADLGETILRMGNLSHANLRMVKLRGANLRRANLHEADLCQVDLSGADLSEADLSAADMTGCILDGVNLNRANLAGADVSGASFWDISNAGWKIEGIKASYVYFCRGQQKEREKYRQDFEDREFEALHRTQPTLELVFEKGLSLPGLFALSALIEKIGTDNPDFGMNLAGISKNEFGIILRVNVYNDDYIPEAGKLLQDAIDNFNSGISADMFMPQLSQMLAADVVNALGNALKAQPANVVIHLDQPIITLIKADGSSSEI